MPTPKKDPNPKFAVRVQNDAIGRQDNATHGQLCTSPTKIVEAKMFKGSGCDLSTPETLYKLDSTRYFSPLRRFNVRTSIENATNILHQFIAYAKAGDHSNGVAAQHCQNVVCAIMYLSGRRFACLKYNYNESEVEDSERVTTQVYSEGDNKFKYLWKLRKISKEHKTDQEEHITDEADTER